MKVRIHPELSALTAIVILALALFSGCDLLDNGGKVPVDKKEKSLDPSEEKQYLLDTGNELSEKVKASDFKGLIELAAYFEKQYGEDSYIDEDFVNKIQEKYSIDEKDVVYYDYNAFRCASPVSAVAGMMKVASAMVAAPGQGVQRAKNAYSVTANLSDFYGGFSPRHQSDGSYCWEWDSSIKNRIEVTFTDQNKQKCVATLKGSSKTISVSISYSWDPIYKGNGDNSEKYDQESEKYIIQVPESITFSLKQGGNEVVAFELNAAGGLTYSMEETDTYKWYEGYYSGYWDLIDEQASINLDFSKLSLNGSLTACNYTESFGTEVTTKGASVSDKVMVNGESLLDSKVEVKGNFANLNSILNDAYNDEVDEDDVVNRFDAMTATVSIMGKVHLDFSCPEIEKFYSAARYLDDCYEESFTRWKTAVESLNKTFSATFYNTNSKVVQGDFYMEPQQEEHWNYTDNVVVPVIQFREDGSVYDISDYLNEEDFDAVIAAFERIGSDFERIVEKAFD